ncbi:MAG: nuclear transport factor 2 family protein [Psychroflexus sp.]|nr:nuclear transport factor 2 family protein [Psychroflexus sp.]
MNCSKLGVVFLLFFSFSLFAQSEQLSVKIDRKISDWHQAAAEADLETYSNCMTKDAVFIGTDPTEYWRGQDFIDFAKPYFDRGKAWTFYKLNRHIYIGTAKQTAWFDELLDTPMGICRGSGILVKQKDQWKIKHYVLSITIPNENVDAVTALKAEFDNNMIEKY